MKQLTTIFQKILRPFFNTRAAGLYIFLFAVSIAVATFIENDFGTSSAQQVVYRALWFEILLLLFCGAILSNIIRYKMIPQRKWSLLLFHGAIIIIILGAGVTRYFGFEGIMHIRENESASSFLSSNSFLKFTVLKNGKEYVFDEPIEFSSLGNNNWKESYLIDNDLIDVTVKEFIPNPAKELVIDKSGNGIPTLKMVVSRTMGREEYFIGQGETKRIGNSIFNFRDQEITGAFNIKLEEGKLFFKSNKVYTQMVMATMDVDTIYPNEQYHPLMLRSLYSEGPNKIVFPEFNESADVRIISEDPKVKNESQVALVLNITVNGTSKDLDIYGSRGFPGIPRSLQFDDLHLSIAYGAKEISVPFSIKLNDFIMEKYPGTNSASSYASEVTLIDLAKSVNMDYRIYMNNILNYGGYRFFQSSFDKDEKGTYLSVNSDYWGTLISYIGYGLLTIGMIMVFFSKRTRFYQVRQKIQQIRNKSGTFIFIAFLSTSVLGQSNSHITSAVSKEHASEFSKVVVQDFKGRMKPMHTLSREILRKLSRKESIDGLTADQVILSMFINKKDWYSVPVIKLGKHEEIHKWVGITENYASYNDFFSENGSYKLRDEVRRVYGLQPIDRGVYEKELLKIDERLNILSMVFSGSIFKIIPIPEDPNNTWEAYSSHSHDDGHNHSTIASNFFNSYGIALKQAIAKNDYNHVGHLLDELKNFQRSAGGEVMPSNTKIRSEIFLNNLNIFDILAGAYIILGIVLLFFLFVSVFKPNWKLKRVYWVLFSLIILGFIFHSLGLGIRWYVSGRAPWSNGYESMIYIAWTSTLAGLIFTRKSFGALAATMVLSATILFVATLSFLDPEITPLVPVLKSYWLTIHVSLEAGSYGFLMLGAIIGLINLILMIFITDNNKDHVKRIIKEMTYISELTLIGGLFMMSIGTYLGGVWANESWGRYWGWDAKETWALVTILVYAFILHMRLIPKLRGLFAYNLATIFGLASVIMTYYGVNYYLSGLHSYATGDPVPIPNWVYVVVISIVIVSILAYWRKSNIKIIS